MLTKLSDVIRKLMYILDRPQKIWGIIVFVLSFFGALIEALGVSAILPLVQIMIEPDALMKNEIVAKISQNFNISSNQEMIIFIVICIIAVYIVKNIYLSFLAYVRCKYSCKIQRELSVKMMKFYMKRGYIFFTEHNSSELIRGVSASPASVFQVMQCGLRLLSEGLTVGTIIITSIVIMDIKLVGVILILIAVSLVSVIFIFKRMTTYFGKRYHQYLARTTKASYQAFQGIKEVLVMNRQDYFTKEYETAYTEQQKATVGQNMASEVPSYFIEAVCITGFLLCVCIQCTHVNNASVLLPSLSSLAVAAFRILPALGRISSGINTVNFYLPAVQDVYDNFLEVEQYNDADQNPSGVQLQGIEGFEEKIVIKGVNWRYPNSEDYVLKNVNLEIRKGESIALIGASGAGKTTLADILLGLLIPEEGDILVDAASIYQCKGKWGKLIGFVSQAFYITDDTIRNNIAFGIEEKKIDDAMVWKALEQAQLKEFVESLDEKLDTNVGERGVRFSGGQRQRLAIARALYESPEILVLDEATAALDNDTESAVMEAVEHLKGKITLVIIAHRLSTIRNCDKVYEVKNGAILERNKEEVLEIRKQHAF